MGNSVNNNFKLIDGIYFDAAWPDVTCVLALFRFAPLLERDPTFWNQLPVPQNPDRKSEYTGTGRWSHLVQFANLAFPKTFEFQDWSTLSTKSYCEHEQTAICGCTTSSKSFSSGLYALTFYLCATASTSVIIVSNTIAGAKKRIWKSISTLYSEFVRKTGYNESRMLGSPSPSICPLLDTGRRDESHGIHIIGTGEGDPEEQINKIKGFHSARILLLGDETDAITQAVPDARANLRSGAQEFQAIWLGNRPSMFNPLGKLMEPEPGKPVTLAHKEWTSTTGIKCFRFDAWDSPNIRDKNKWSGIVRQQDIDAAVKDAGSANAPIIWIMYHGLEPPEGADNTVLSEAAINRFRCREGVQWMGGFISSGSLDPGFGGDPCVLRFFRRGLTFDGSVELKPGELLMPGHGARSKLRIHLFETVTIPIDADDPSNPAEFQISHRVKLECQNRGVAPEEFAILATGTGRGAAAVLQREWSPSIYVIEEGGAPSEMPTSDQDTRPANERYDRKITEIYLSIREFVHADMIRGMDEPTARQLCERQIGVKNRKQSLEKKEDMKARGVPSPNDADALGGYIDMIRQKGVNAQIVTEVTQAASQVLEEASNEFDEIEEESYLAID